jgi:FAD/FMN-containing dehydrogenase
MGASTALSLNECLAPNKSALPEDLAIDCHDMPTSLDTILVHLLGEGSSFGGNVLTAGDGKLYEEASHQYASARVKTAPSFIVEAMNQADVRAAVMFASACGHKVTARSGGHSYVGSSSCDGGITSCIQLDVGNLNHVDVALPQVHVGPGVRLEDLFPVLVSNNVFIPAGECEGVGVGGHGKLGSIANELIYFRCTHMTMTRYSSPNRWIQQLDASVWEIQQLHTP